MFLLPKAKAVDRKCFSRCSCVQCISRVTEPLAELQAKAVISVIKARDVRSSQLSEPKRPNKSRRPAGSLCTHGASHLTVRSERPSYT